MTSQQLAAAIAALQLELAAQPAALACPTNVAAQILSLVGSVLGFAQAIENTVCGNVLDTAASPVTDQAGANVTDKAAS